jgi:hypothetical protein
MTNFEIGLQNKNQLNPSHPHPSSGKQSQTTRERALPQTILKHTTDSQSY